MISFPRNLYRAQKSIKNRVPRSGILGFRATIGQLHSLAKAKFRVLTVYLQQRVNCSREFRAITTRIRLSLREFYLVKIPIVIPRRYVRITRKMYKTSRV